MSLDSSWKEIPGVLKMTPEVREIMEKAIEAEDQALRELLVSSSVKELDRLCDELASRQIEALNMYRPREIQDQFHSNPAFIRLVLGSNRGGKTLAAAVETARCLTNQDPHKKFPPSGILYAVGRDLKHVGEVQWAKLASFGAFRMIRDPKTREWRAWNPLNKWDKANEKLAKPAPPLIPQRFIADVAWEDKKSKIPAKVSFTTGWEARFWSSQADAPQGFAVDCVWFDEEIVGDAWFSELVARGLVDRNGLMWWSATPQARTVKLYELHQRGLDPEDKDVEEFRLHIKDNQYLSDDSKRRFFEGLSPSEVKVRWDGEFALTTMVVYPEFNATDPVFHLREDVNIPPEYSRYLIVDPGFQTCAVLAVAIPPAGNEFIIYDELYIKRGNSEKFAQECREKFSGQVFQRFIMDMQMGRQTQMATGNTVQWHYSEELRKVGISSIETSEGFQAGSSDKKAREEAFRKLMVIRGETGRSVLKVCAQKCPWFCWEMSKQFYKPRGDLVTDERLDRDNHLVTCAEMAAAANLKYVKPKKGGAHKNWWLRILQEKEERRNRETGGGPSIRCAPGRS